MNQHQTLQTSQNIQTNLLSGGFIPPHPRSPTSGSIRSYFGSNLRAFAPFFSKFPYLFTLKMPDSPPSRSSSKKRSRPAKGGKPAQLHKSAKAKAGPAKGGQRHGGHSQRRGGNKRFRPAAGGKPAQLHKSAKAKAGPAIGGEPAKRRKRFQPNPVEEDYRRGLGQSDDDFAECHPHVIPLSRVVGWGGFQLILSMIESVGGVVVPVKDGCVGSRLGNVCSLDFRRMVFR